MSYKDKSLYKNHFVDSRFNYKLENTEIIKELTYKGKEYEELLKEKELDKIINKKTVNQKK